MRFLDLSIDAKMKAMNDYQEGWLESHPNDKLELDEIYDILSIDLDDETSYDEDGNLIKVDL